MREICPRCGCYSVSVNTFRGNKTCHKTGCGFEEKVDVEKYLQENDMLEKLTRPLVD